MNSDARLIAHINREDWWHVPPCDPEADSPERSRNQGCSFNSLGPPVPDGDIIHERAFGRSFTRLIC